MFELSEQRSNMLKSQQCLLIRLHLNELEVPLPVIQLNTRVLSIICEVVKVIKLLIIIAQSFPSCKFHKQMRINVFSYVLVFNLVFIHLR